MKKTEVEVKVKPHQALVCLSLASALTFQDTGGLFQQPSLDGGK
jgi:hypothetical protein